MGECVLSPWKPLALLSDDDVDKLFAPVWRHPGTSYVTILRSVSSRTLDGIHFITTI